MAHTDPQTRINTTFPTTRAARNPGELRNSGLGARVFAWVALSLVIAVSYAILATRAPKVAQPVAGFLVLAWVAAAVVLALSDLRDLLWTHGVPLALVLLAAFAKRVLRVREARDVALALAGVARSAPYVAPVVLIAVLLPALNADVWELAANLGPEDLAAATLLSVGVLLLLVAGQLRRELEPALAARSRSLAARAETPEESRTILREAVDGDTARLVDELPTERFAELWPASSDEYAPYIASVEGSSLRRPLRARLAITAGAIGLMLGAYIYALLAVTVPKDVAAGWTNTTIGSQQVGLFGIDVNMPCGPYASMAVLLGVFSTAIFLAFAVTEERIAATLAEALLREPIDRFLLLAVPFVSLVEWGLENPEQIQELSELSDSSEGAEEPPGSGGGSVSESSQS